MPCRFQAQVTAGSACGAWLEEATLRIGYFSVAVIEHYDQKKREDECSACTMGQFMSKELEMKEHKSGGSFVKRMQSAIYSS